MKYVLGVAIVAIIAVVFVTLLSSNDASSSVIVFDEKEFDFGVVKQSGGIQTHDFSFTYVGEDPVTITGLPTSCGCTTARASITNLTKGTKGIITVMFDPNLHAEPVGRFYKTVSFLTSSSSIETPELKIWAEVDLDLGEDAYKEQLHEGEVLLETENLSPQKDYKTIHASTLKEALEDKHFFLVDVHTPEQTHIPGTDVVITYDEIEDHLDQLPADKNAEIVLYCSSGSMSQQAAQTLSDLGYTNVYHVQGGIQAFNEL